MARIVDPLHDNKKLTEHLAENPKRVGIVFYHGLGDLVMFLNPFHELKRLFPQTEFQLILQGGLSFEDICPDAYFLKPGDMENLEALDYDIVAKVHFPMNEGQQQYTKGEWCCLHELGIEPVWGHRLIPQYPSKLIGVHFNITCLPDSCNPDEQTAKMVWQDIIDAGFIPIETHFQHAFHNPVNTKFDFVDCSVRKTHAKIRNLVGLMGSLAGFVGVVSGNFHVALSMLPSNRVFFLQKHFKLECFTRLPVSRASIFPDEYKHEVKDWLSTLT
jgi:hypothetical protein